MLHIAVVNHFSTSCGIGQHRQMPKLIIVDRTLITILLGSALQFYWLTGVHRETFTFCINMTKSRDKSCLERSSIFMYDACEHLSEWSFLNPLLSLKIS